MENSFSVLNTVESSLYLSHTF